MARIAKKRHYKSDRQKLKDACWTWMALYVKLRDAIEDKLDPDFRFVRCRTCGKVLERYYYNEKGERKSNKSCQAGHFMGRKSGGSSGTYFDERNVHVQCANCNAFEQGAHKEFRAYLVNKFNEETVQDIERKHTIHSYSDMDIIILETYYKNEYEKLCEQYNIK